MGQDRVDQNRPNEPPATVREHLANERTMLAWVRTAITVMALGFVIARFVAADSTASDPAAQLVGVGFVLLGGVMALTAALRFVRIEKEIDRASYRPWPMLDLVLTGAVVIGAVVLALLLFAESR